MSSCRVCSFSATSTGFRPRLSPALDKHPAPSSQEIKNRMTSMLPRRAEQHMTVNTVLLKTITSNVRLPAKCRPFRPLLSTAAMLHPALIKVSRAPTLLDRQVRWSGVFPLGSRASVLASYWHKVLTISPQVLPPPLPSPKCLDLTARCNGVLPFRLFKSTGIVCGGFRSNLAISMWLFVPSSAHTYARMVQTAIFGTGAFDKAEM